MEDMNLKKIIKKTIFGKRASSDAYINHLRNIGVKIGNDVTIYVPTKTLIDEQYPWMITIGNHVRITEGVKILTHDYSWSVLKLLNLNNESGVILGASGKVTIGDNVFIGMNSIILRNVTIGDNVIIGSGSVVTKDCDSGYVYAGNPAKKIMKINEFFEKRKEAQLSEAKELALQYYERYGKMPEKEIFHEYFMLFTQNDDLQKCFIEKMKQCNNYEESVRYIEINKPLFHEFKDFIKYCFNDGKEKNDTNNGDYK